MDEKLNIKYIVVYCSQSFNKCSTRAFLKHDEDDRVRNSSGRLFHKELPLYEIENFPLVVFTFGIYKLYFSLCLVRYLC